MFVQRTRILRISLLAIFSAFVVELVFGLVSNSLGLVTDSIHALLDSIVTIILLLAAKMASKSIKIYISGCQDNRPAILNVVIP